MEELERKRNGTIGNRQESKTAEVETCAEQKSEVRTDGAGNFDRSSITTPDDEELSCRLLRVLFSFFWGSPDQPPRRASGESFP